MSQRTCGWMPRCASHWSTQHTIATCPPGPQRGPAHLWHLLLALSLHLTFDSLVPPAMGCESQVRISSQLLFSDVMMAYLHHGRHQALHSRSVSVENQWIHIDRTPLPHASFLASLLEQIPTALPSSPVGFRWKPS